MFAPILPFALVLGVAINDSVMPTAVAWSTSVLIFAGAAQLATVSLAGTTTWLALVATATVINLRHVMYSAAMAPRFQGQPMWFRIFGPFVLIDQVFALMAGRTDLDRDAFRRLYVATGLFFYISWNVTVVVGMLVGGAIPGSWRLDVAPSVMFAGLVIVGIVRRGAAVAALAAAGVTFAALGLPNNLGLLLGAVVGIAAGYAVDRTHSDRPSDRAAS